MTYIKKFPGDTGIIETDRGPCACVGPQNGEPLCPCSMRKVYIKDGHYWWPAEDLGPVPPDAAGEPNGGT